MDHAPVLGARARTRITRRGVVLGGLSAGLGLVAAGTLPSSAARLPRAALVSVPRRRSAPAGSAPDRAVGSAGSRPGMVEAPPPPPAPSFVRRANWTDRAPAANHNPMPRIGRLTVHHTGADTRALGATDLQTVQRIEGYHREQLGWACVGYHFLIGEDGTIYEGRPLALQGAHVRDANRGNLGVSLIGDCHQQPPSPHQLASLSFVLDAARRRYHLRPDQVFGHRDLAPTTCPGDQLYAWLRTWRSDSGASGERILA